MHTFLYPKCCTQLTNLYDNVIPRTLEISHASVMQNAFIFVHDTPVVHSQMRHFLLYLNNKISNLESEHLIKDIKSSLLFSSFF